MICTRSNSRVEKIAHWVGWDREWRVLQVSFGWWWGGEGAEQNPCTFLIRKTHGRKPLVRLWHRLEDNAFLWFMVQRFRRVRNISKGDCELRHVCPSVRVEQLWFHWTKFREILYLSNFSKIYFKKFRFHWNLTRRTAVLYVKTYVHLL